MSGICGIVAADGALAHGDIEAMLARLQRRGPDRSAQWSGGPVALGHALLATTAEAWAEQLPLRDEASGCVITADVRLDNRAELIEALGIDQAAGDGELILRAYLKWGDACPGRLLGDFAFAIWDPRAAALFCARDQMGMRQLIYHHAPGERFVFATQAEAVLAHGAVPRRVNEARIADYLDDLEGLDLTSTMFEQLFRLPPAHWLRVSDGRLTLERYWQLEAPPPLELPSDQAYADAFLAVFGEAVRCRLRSDAPVGAMLSGGIDSGSVVAVASGLLAASGGGPLQTFSAVGADAAGCVETRAIREARAISGLDPVSVGLDAIDPLAEELQRSTEAIGEPFDGHMVLVRTVYAAARRAGRKVVLDGVAGDVVLSSDNRVAAALRNRAWRAAWREARGGQRYWKAPGHAARLLIASAWVAFAPRPLRRAKRRLAALTGKLALRLGRPVPWPLAREAGLARRRAAYRGHLGDTVDVEHRLQTILHPHLVAARERYDREAAAIGIEPRDPFMDLRLIRLCLSLPADQVERDGWPKLVLRRAMAGRLPETVIWRCGKEHLGWAFTQALFERWPGWRDRLAAGAGRLSRYASGRDVERLARPPARVLTRKAADYFYLLLWLNRIDALRH